MIRSPSLKIAVALGVVWTTITVGGGIAQAGGTTSLDKLVSEGIVLALPAAAALLLIATLVGGWRRAVGITAPQTLRVALLPALFVVALLGLAVASGLPETEILTRIAINTAFVGISEELMFRGVLLAPLVASFGIRRGVLFGALAFGAVHSLNALATGEIGPAVAQSALAIGMGLWAARLRLATGSLFAPIVLHGLWDLALVAVIAGGGTTTLALAASVTALVGAVVLGIVAWRGLGALTPAR